MQLRPIYTEPDNCQDCYKCIRECPVKAIRMENNQASIIEDRCIYCGHCTQVCPTGAKKIRDGLTRAKLTLTQNPKVILSRSWNRHGSDRKISGRSREWRVHLFGLSGGRWIYPKIFPGSCAFYHSDYFSHAGSRQDSEPTVRGGRENCFCRSLYLQKTGSRLL